MSPGKDACGSGQGVQDVVVMRLEYSRSNTMVAYLGAKVYPEVVETVVC